MLKNNDLIAKLTDNQKIHFLTDVASLTEKDLCMLGIRGVKVSSIKDSCSDAFPRSAMLANSWDEQLWVDVARAKASHLIADGTNLAIVPGSKIKLSPYSEEITEDPYFATRFSASCVAAVESSGLKAALSGYYLTESDEQWLDDEPSERVLNEYFAQPYARALKAGEDVAVMTDMKSVSDKYKSIVSRLQDNLSGDHYLICERADNTNTVDFIARGIICLSASSTALESAMIRYSTLKQASDRKDKVTPEQIHEEENARTAISPETVDAALDRVIEFLKGLKKTVDVKAVDEEEISKRAMLESSVLLKNDGGILPLTKKHSVAIIGDAYLEKETLKRELQERRFFCVGVERGYDCNDISNNEIMEKAASLAASASAVILFLGFDQGYEKQIPKVKSLELPANQLRLAEMLVRRNSNVIGVISASCAPDIAFTRGFKAVMLVPTEVKTSAAAMAALLCGEQSPSGRLAYTLYAGSDAAFEKRDLYKKKYGLKSGPFIGYRYYDTAKLNIGYPFGHGLSYTSFEYYDLAYHDGKVSVTVENTGEARAKTVVQVYVGCDDDKVLRPQKELCGFAKIELDPHETKRVSIDIELPGVYQAGTFKVVGGRYSIYVGESSYDIRASKHTTVFGENIPGDGERIRDYIQSVPNVTEDSFTLEAARTIKRAPRKMTIAALASLALAVCMLIINALGVSSVILGVVSGSLVVASMVLFAIDLLKARTEYENELQIVSGRNEQYFANAVQIPVLSTAMIFNEEFDVEEEKREEPTLVEEVEPDIDQSIDTGFKLADLANEITVYARSIGMELGAGVAAQLAASLVNSRLMILDGLSAEEFDGLMTVISGCFATKAYVENLTGAQNGAAELFFGFDSYGNFVKKPAVMALESATSAIDKVHVLAVNGVNAMTFERLTTPFEGYLGSPRSVNAVSVTDPYGQSANYVVSNNLKLIVRLDDAVTVDMLSGAALCAASYNHVSLTRCQPQTIWNVRHASSRFQLEYILEKEKNVASVTEQIYKKIDKLESYVASHADYKIKNKLWISLENQIGLLLSTKMEIDDAVDAAIATKLLPSMSAALRNNLAPEDETLKEIIAFVLGDEHSEASLRFVNMLEGQQVQNDVTDDKAADADVTDVNEIQQGAENNV